MKALLACDARRPRTAANGLPHANRHRPCVASTASSNVHSDRWVGLDSGKMAGAWRGLAAAMASSAARVNAPLTPLTPTSAVGRTA